MAYGFRLTAKRDVCKKNSGTVVVAKGMSFEHVEQSCSAPQSPNVIKTIKQKFGEEVTCPTVSLYFDIQKM